MHMGGGDISPCPPRIQLPPTSEWIILPYRPLYIYYLLQDQTCTFTVCPLKDIKCQSRLNTGY